MRLWDPVQGCPFVFSELCCQMEAVSKDVVPPVCGPLLLFFFFCCWWLNLMVKWDQVLETMKSVHYSCCVCISCFIFWSLKFVFLSHSSWTQLVLYSGQLVQQSTFSRRLCALLPATTSRDLRGLHRRLLPTLSDQNRVLWWKHMLDCTTSFMTLTRMQKQERNQEALTWRRLQTSTYLAW